MYTFPLTQPRDTEVILTPPDGYDVSSIKRIYKNAVVSELHGPNDRAPQLYSINIPATDIVAAHGVHATLYPSDPARAPVDLTLPTADFDWASKDAQDAKARSVRLSTTLKVISYATYNFHVTGTDSTNKQGSLLVDGYDVTGGVPITLGTGLHSVVVMGTAGSSVGSAAMSLLWNGGASGASAATQPIPDNLLFDPRKVEPRGLTGVFRNGESLTRSPRMGG